MRGWPPPANRGLTFRKLLDWLGVLVWPLIGLFVITVLWSYTLSRNSTAREEAEADVRREAIASATSYVQQMRHMVEHIDQITLRLKYQWENKASEVNLEDEREFGLFPAGQLLYANIFDHNGDVVTTTIPERRPASIAKQPYFLLHQSSCCAGLHISHPGPSTATGRPIIRFSRRLDRPDGSFGGVAVVAVEPPYLVTFQEDAVPGKYGFASVRLNTGTLLASKTVGNNDGFGTYDRQDPVFATLSGVALEPQEKFKDGRARYVAWKTLDGYPLVVLAGLSYHDAMAPYAAQAERDRRMAVVESVVILLGASTAAYVAHKLRRRRRQIEETQKTYRMATDAANEGFYMLRPIYNRRGEAIDFCLEDCNNKAGELLGTTRTHLVGKNVSEFQPDSFRDEIMARCKITLEKGVLEEEQRVPSSSPIRAQWVYRRSVRSDVGLAVTIRDISEAKKQEEALADLANNDVLTRLPNRNSLTAFLPSAINSAAKRSGQLALLFIDLDNFKDINDTLGHDAGDDLLVQAAQRLRDAVRASDYVARLGGDEFIVILADLNVEEDVTRVANGLVNAISKPFELNAGTGNQVCASIGISLYPQDGNDADTLLKNADIAMYAAKAAGKGRFAFYHAHLSDSLILRLSKERALREAIANDEFVVHYQPRVGLASGELTSMEALVRWERPQHGLVYPSEFIDVAEDMGLIIQIGEIVIEKVCRQIAQWKQQGLPMVPVSVNVSAAQLKTGTFSPFLSRCIRQYGIPPGGIEAELVESAVVDRSKVVSSELAALRQFGIKLLIDDFGTGYSSISQLHRLDVDVLKVDTEFTRALCEGSEAQMLFRAIMSMAEALDMSVVAEGVETIDQVNILHNLSCDEIQGYFISKAVAAGEMGQMMLKHFLLAPPGGPNRLQPA
jgi:diguanylate cyclase (GGDEF)-like protein/PAS domain S-box-containing protein